MANYCVPAREVERWNSLCASLEGSTSNQSNPCLAGSRGDCKLIPQWGERRGRVQGNVTLAMHSPLHGGCSQTPFKRSSPVLFPTSKWCRRPWAPTVTDLWTCRPHSNWLCRFYAFNCSFMKRWMRADGADGRPARTAHSHLSAVFLNLVWSCW